MHRGATVIEHPLAGSLLSQLRHKDTPAGEFRRLLNDLGRLMAFEATRDLETEPRQIETPLGTAAGTRLARGIVLVPILRAGLGMLGGFVEALPDARVGHIGMARDEHSLEPECYYCKLPGDLGSADTILIDPMLATGNSSSAAVDELKARGARRIRFACAVACPEGIAHLSSRHPDVPIFTASVDERLDGSAYIFPGLGDAGDRLFGTA